MTIGSAVGTGLANQPDDVRVLGQALAVEGMLTSQEMSIERVISALAELKRRMLSGARPLQPVGAAGGVPGSGGAGGPGPGSAARPLSLGLVTLTLARAGVTPAQWYGSFVAASFLGNTTYDGRGLHPELQNRLTAAETALLRMGSAESFGIHLNDKLRGFRSPPGGLHSYGLAVDINYATNPWITQATWKAAANAGLLVRKVPLASNPITRQPSGVTAPGAAYDLLSQASADLVAYFALKDDGAALAAAAAAAAAAAGAALDQAGLNMPARTVDQWRRQIGADFAAVGPDF